MTAVQLLLRARRRVRGWSDAMLLARVGLVMGLLPLVARLDTMRLLRLLERVGRWCGTSPRWPDDDVVRAVRGWGGLRRWSFQDNCVSQSLTLFTLLNRAAAPLDVVFGVEVRGAGPDGPRLGRRHVWLERSGVAVFEREPLARYLVQARYRAARVPAGDTLRPLLGALGGSSLATAVNSAAVLVRTKAIAVVAGSAGLAVAGQAGAAIQSLGWIATLGASAAPTRYLAEAEASGDIRRAATVVRTTGLLLGFAAILLAAPALLAAQAVAPWLFGPAGRTSWAVWLALVLPFLGLQSLSTAVLRGTRAVKRLALGQVVSAAAIVAVTLALVDTASLDRVVLAIVVGTGVSAVVLAAAAWPEVRRSLGADAPLFDRTLARNVAWYGLSSAVMGVATAVIGLTVGRAYLAAGRTADAGHIAALAWFAEPLVTIFVSGLYATTFPAYCAATRGDASRIVSRAVRALVLLTVPPLVAAAAAAPALLRLLFTDAIAVVAPLLPLQLFATYLRSVNVLLGLPLLARGHVAAVTILHVLWACGTTALALHGMAGPAGYVEALALMGVLQSAALLVLLNVLGLSPRGADVALVAAGAVPLVLLSGLRP